MKKIYNFSAGPACLPQQAITSSIESIKNFKQSGMSLLEMSHRSVQVVDLFEETTNNIIELLNIPKNYSVLWLQGGASLQFSMVPMNLLPRTGSADYIDTGSWSAKAITECEKFGKANVIGSSKDSTYSYIPKDVQISSNSSYLHITSNNTIYGTQYKNFPKIDNNNTFLVADMSSDILSKTIDISKFGLIYAGAQKNIGPAGVTLVIIRSDLLELKYRDIPTMMSYNTHASKDSMFNTPPVFSVCVVNETLKWLKQIGGLDSMAHINELKAELLYQEINRNTLFKSPINKEDRSLMNVPFIFDNNEIDDNVFLDFCLARGLTTLKGHRSVGGFRASIYNAMPQEGVEVLIKTMQEFENKYS
ncbi:MAG: 3-phosphoserine/phosphohydroxythreonine transaminase [Candidatus Neomarinimicrobiota bacterium]